MKETHVIRSEPLASATAQLQRVCSSLQPLAGLFHKASEDSKGRQSKGVFYSFSRFWESQH